MYGDDHHLEKMVHKNLYKYVKEKEGRKLCSELIFRFLVDNQKNLVILLTNGNLETKYHNREIK